MFDNPGDKIKTWANIVFILGLIASVISGIVIIAMGSGAYYGYGGGNAFLSGLIVIIVGSVASWLSSLLLYALGSAVESLERIEDRMAHLEGAIATQNATLDSMQKSILLSQSGTPAPAASQIPAAKVLVAEAIPNMENTANAPVGEESALPEWFTVVKHEGVSLTCPACGTGQFGNRKNCINCGIAFVEKDTYEKAVKYAFAVEIGKQYAVVARDKLRLVCPACQTEQANGRNVCWKCGLSFIIRDAVKVKSAADNEVPDNSGQRVPVNHSTLTLQCPLCGERQPSNVETCRKCKAAFTDQA